MLNTMINATMTVEELLKTKGREYWAVAPGATVFEALELMADKDIGALLVTERGALIGIFSERDYARKVILKGKTSRETTVGELMTAPVVCIDPGRTLQEALAVMTVKKIRHLPVISGGKPAGVITLGDVVKRIISQQEHAIQALEQYVCAKP